MKRYMVIEGERIEVPLLPGEILHSLLGKLREGQSFCPYCSGEYVCESECVLDGIWFERVEEARTTQLPDVDPDCDCIERHTDECPWTDL